MNYFSGEISRKEILEAATEIFIKKGYSGARVQEIADYALVNKGMVFYYFKTKDDLYKEVFINVFDEMTNHLFKVLKTDEPIKEKLYNYTKQTYDAALNKYDKITFLFNEINLYPEKALALVMNDNVINYEMLQKQCDIETSKGLTKKVNIKELLMMITSLVLFPVLGRHIYSKLYGYAYSEDFLVEQKKRMPFINNLIDANLDIT